MLRADGFDEAVIGMDLRTGVLVYSYSKCIEILEKRDSMTNEEAVEFMDFNVIGAYVGEKTPIFMASGKLTSEGFNEYN